MSAGETWHDFWDDPVSHIHPERLSLCLGGTISPSLCIKLKTSARLRTRLAAVIGAHYRLPSGQGAASCWERDRAAITASPERLEEIAMRAGAIYWSAAIANTVLAAGVAALRAAIGEELCAFAVKHRDLGVPERSLAPLETLRARMSDDGWLCMAAWGETLDPAIAARLSLKLPAMDILDIPAPPLFQEIGPEIVRRAAA